MPKKKNLRTERPLQIKLWYDELNYRLKNELKDEFMSQYPIAESSFYSLISKPTMELNRAIFFADFFSEHLVPCHVRDLYRHPLEVIQDYEETKKKWGDIEEEPKVIYKRDAAQKSQAILAKHRLALK